MKRTILSAVFVLSVVVCAACGRKVTLPIKTSLGDLIKIEKKANVNTNKDPVVAKSGETVYLLSFAGQKEYEVKDAAAPDLISLTGGLTDNSDIKFTNFSVAAGPGLAGALNLPLVDENGKHFAPVFFGSASADGVISNSGARFNGNVTGRDGKPWVKTGKFEFAEPGVTVVYVVPEGATLTLKDGAQDHPIN